MPTLLNRPKDKPWNMKAPPRTSACTMHTGQKHGTVKACGRTAANPAGGWYGLKKGLRGRFGVYIRPLMEELGLCGVEHDAKNNRMRAR